MDRRKPTQAFALSKRGILQFASIFAAVNVVPVQKSKFPILDGKADSCRTGGKMTYVIGLLLVGFIVYALGRSLAEKEAEIDELNDELHKARDELRSHTLVSQEEDEQESLPKYVEEAWRANLIECQVRESMP